MSTRWDSDCGRVTLYCGDSRDILRDIDTSAIDAVVTDPPYGISYNGTHDKYKNGIDRGMCEWDAEPFNPQPILTLNLPTIMWGGNCFASKLPDHAGWLSWRKTVRNGAKIRQADMELAWTNCIRRSQTFEHLWIGAYKASESGIRNEHPTQKPIAVMAWCLSLLPKAETILDPFMGSGTTGVAAVQLGRRFVGIEIEPKYFEIAKRRIAEALAMPKQQELVTT